LISHGKSDARIVRLRELRIFALKPQSNTERTEAGMPQELGRAFTPVYPSARSAKGFGFALELIVEYLPKSAPLAREMRRHCLCFQQRSVSCEQGTTTLPFPQPNHSPSFQIIPWLTSPNHAMVHIK
jgi:hypothetical protein